MYISHLSVFIQIILKANAFSFHTKNGYLKERVVYFALCGTVPSSRKFSVDKVWEAAATLGQGGNFFVPAATVISSSLNYASAEVSSSVSQAGTERERIEESCHTKFIEPRNTSSPSCHIGRPRKRPSAEQWSNRKDPSVLQFTLTTSKGNSVKYTYPKLVSFGNAKKGFFLFFFAVDGTPYFLLSSPAGLIFFWCQLWLLTLIWW